MLYWTIIFLIIAIIAGVMGFGGIAFASAGIVGRSWRLQTVT